MSFRTRARKMKKDLEKRTEEAIESKDDSGGSDYISIFKKDEIPEGMEFWSPGFGEHLVDIIPFFTGENVPKIDEGRLCYVLDLWVHMVGDNFVCQTRNFKQRDPICDYIKKNRLPKEEFKKVASKRRTVYLVWVHDSPEEEDKGLQIWEVSHFLFEFNIDAIAKNPKGGVPVIFADEDKGKTIAFEIQKYGTFKDANGVDRDGQKWVGHRFIDRDEKIPDEILEQSFSLDDIVDMHPDTDTVYKSFHGEGGEEKQPEKEEETEEEQEEETEEEQEEAKTEEEQEEDEANAEEEQEETKADGQECPAGATFGVDCDTYENCDNCDLYDDCSDECERLEKEEEAKKEAAKKKTVVKKKAVIKRIVLKKK